MIKKDFNELKKESAQILGEDLGKLFVYLRNELVILESNWSEFEELFGTNQKRVDLLNEAARHFFGNIQNLLFEATLLHISRITDPPETKAKGKSHKNLSIKGLTDLLPEGELKEKVTEQIDSALKASDFARTWRMKRIAHADFIHETDNAVNLPFASRDLVKKSILEIRMVLDLISEQYFGGPTGPVAQIHEGAVSLLYYLRDGQKFRKQAQERVDNGVWDEELDGAESI